MQHKWKRLISYYRPYRGLFFSDMVFAILGAAVTLAIPLIRALYHDDGRTSAG